MSQLLLRLRNDLSSATDVGHRVELLALIACCLARQARFHESRLAINEAREMFPGGQGGLGTIWVMLAEGLLHFFEHQSPEALDRIARAQILSLSIRHRKLAAITSAWKAHIEFENSRFDAMFASLRVAQENLSDTDHDAWSRFSMVLFNSFTICGDTRRARDCFLKAHSHAIENGDLASVEALLYNHAAFTLSRLRVENCISLLDGSALNRIRMELASSRNLTSLVQAAALKNYFELVAARLSILEQSYANAIEKLQSIRHQTPFASYNFDQSYIELELCYCHFRLDHVDRVSAYLDGQHAREFPDLDIDEQIVAAWMLWQMSLTDARFGDAAALRARFEQLHANYTAARAGLLEGLRNFAD